MIRTEALTKTFGDVTALDGLTLDIAPGEVFGFLGPNGAGKTTTVKLLSGLLRPTAGRAWIDGVDVQADPRRARKLMGLVPDQPYVYPLLSGKEFMRFVGDLYEVELAEQKRRIPDLLAMFELSDVGDDLVESYSHGMRQKLVLASVLLHRPRAVFLDEPMVGLDPKSARLVKDVIGELARQGVAFFMCTHVLEVAERLCDRIAIVQKGRMTHQGTVAQLRAHASVEGSLEDAFLTLTGGTEYREMLKFL
jgi:ABC-2 type transport system ATP-binding protein